MKNPLDQLPHGPGFRFIDSLTELVAGRSATGTYLIRGDEPFLEAHFPGNPMMPGVLMIEAIAQLAGIAANATLENAPGLLLTAVQKVKISSSAKPGETLTIQVEIKGRLGSLIQAYGSVTCGEDTLVSGQVVLSEVGA